MFHKTNLLWVMMNFERPLEPELLQALAVELDQTKDSLRYMSQLPILAKIILHYEIDSQTYPDLLKAFESHCKICFDHGGAAVDNDWRRLVT